MDVVDCDEYKLFHKESKWDFAPLPFYPERGKRTYSKKIGIQIPSKKVGTGVF